MSKRPTFQGLIDHYGQAVHDAAQVEVTPADPTGPFWEQRAKDAKELLVRALRKAGVPLDQVAP